MIFRAWLLLVCAVRAVADATLAIPTASRRFYSTWFEGMMARIEEASDVVTQGFAHAHLKPDDSPVTDVDIASSHILTDGWNLTHIISEETWTAHYAKQDRLPTLLTWVDPLDATQEYTEGLTEFVSIMACLTENGRPKAGIIHFPFRNETWVALDGRVVSPRPLHSPPDTVVVSRSHAGSVASFVAGYAVQPAGGSGYKSVEVVSGRAVAYLHTTKIKTWDICAADALVHALNGTFTEWSTGQRFNYTKHLHENGLFASVQLSRMSFIWTNKLRSWGPAMVAIAWILVYTYPQENLVQHVHKSTSAPVSFAMCATALLTCYITWGIAQERIMAFEYDGERFTYPAVLVFLSRCISAAFARCFVSQQTTPLRLFSLASVTNIVSSMCQYVALMSTIFPVVVVFKSLKLIPVLIVGRCCFKKRYKPVAYGLALGLAVGVSLTLVSKAKGATQQSVVGMLLMVGYVVADALTSQLQSYILKSHNTPPLEMMWGVNTCSVLFTGILVGTSGQFWAAAAFAHRHPEFLIHVSGLCFPGVIGQWFIYKTIEQHGAAAFVMVMTSRQAFSLMASCLLFGHQLDAYSIVGIVIVMGVLYVKTRVNISAEDVYEKLPPPGTENRSEKVSLLEKGRLKD